MGRAASSPGTGAHGARWLRVLADGGHLGEEGGPDARKQVRHGGTLEQQLAGLAATPVARTSA